MRIHLSGRICIDAGELRIGPGDFPGQQGRAAFAVLAGEQPNPVSRDTLIEAIWPMGAPAARDSALNSIVSKLRSLLTRAGLDGAATLVAGAGCYELQLPPGTWIDHEAASDAIHEAESALRVEDPARAYGPSAVAHHIARRPFMPGENGQWFDARREKLERILVRALECRAEVYLWNRELPLAIEAARDVVRMRPFREQGYRLLMRAHATSGNAAEALRVYERCRVLISEELGVPPSPETRALHQELLASL